MSRYLKEDSVIKSITAEIKSDKDASMVAKMMLADVPEEDEIEVVRCRECMWSTNKTKSGHRYCEVMNDYAVDDGFCSWGEKNK